MVVAVLIAVVVALLVSEEVRDVDADVVADDVGENVSLVVGDVVMVVDVVAEVVAVVVAEAVAVVVVSVVVGVVEVVGVVVSVAVALDVCDVVAVEMGEVVRLVVALLVKLVVPVEVALLVPVEVALLVREVVGVLVGVLVGVNVGLVVWLVVAVVECVVVALVVRVVVAVVVRVVVAVVVLLVVAVVVAVDVCVVVWVEVAVDVRLVVCEVVVVAVVVLLVVCEVVGDVVGVVVCVVLRVLVKLVVGVVRTQLAKTPSAYDDTALFRIAACVGQSVGAARYLPWIHVSLPSAPPGPAAALTTAFTEPARASQVSSPPATNTTSSSSCEHCMVTLCLHVARTRFIQLLPATQSLCPLLDDSSTVLYFATHTKVGVGGVAVGVDVSEVVCDVVMLVVGEVLSQVWNPPAAYCVAMSLSVATVALHWVGSGSYTSPLLVKHASVLGAPRGGPRHSEMACPRVAAPALQLPSPATASTPARIVLSQVSSVLPPQALRIRFSIATCRRHGCLLRT